MQRLISLLATLGMLLAPISPVHAAEDESWIPVSNSGPGYHSMLIQEKTQFFQTFPRLESLKERLGKRIQCNSIKQAECKTEGVFNAHYPVCDADTTSDCIANFSIIRDTRETMGEFVDYIYQDHVGRFKGDGKRIMKEVESPSIWSFPDEPHAYGDKYLVAAGEEGGYGKGYVNSASYAAIYAIELIQTDCVDCIPKCETDVGCGGAANDWFGGLNCLFVSDSGLCAVHRPLPDGIRISLNIRTTANPTGWFHGRMQDPVIDIGSYGKQKVLSITAAPVQVPVLFLEPTKYSDLPKKLQDYWTNCLLKSQDCPTGTRIANSAENKNIWNDGNKRQAESVFPSSHWRSIEAVKVFAPYVDDKSAAAPSSWSYRTLEQNQQNNRCLNNDNGVQGIVTTNAIAYEDGAPIYSKGSLNYKVAGLHYMQDGTEAQGSYDLVMRSEVARCLYGFSTAPISGSISVSGDGDRTIATTVVSEKNGWLKLAAYGFTFSEKTLKIKLTQKKTTITCVAETDPSKTKKVTGYSPKCPTGYKKK